MIFSGTPQRMLGMSAATHMLWHPRLVNPWFILQLLKPHSHPVQMKWNGILDRFLLLIGIVAYILGVFDVHHQGHEEDDCIDAYGFRSHMPTKVECDEETD